MSMSIFEEVLEIKAGSSKLLVERIVELRGS